MTEQSSSPTGTPTGTAPGTPTGTATGSADWALAARERYAVFDGWIAASLVGVILGFVGLVASVHTDGGAPLVSKAPLVFGGIFVLSAVLLATSIAGSVLNRSMLAVLEATLEGSAPASAPE